MESLVFTPAGLLELLLKIDELKDYNITILETIDGKIQLQIGDSIYELDSSESTDVEVDEDVIEEVEDVNVETYQSLEDDISFETGEDVVESGFLKEAAKALLLGGMIKLSAKLIK